MSKITFVAVLLNASKFYILFYVMLYQPGFSRKAESIDSLSLSTPLSFTIYLFICKEIDFKNLAPMVLRLASLKYIGQFTRLEIPAKVYATVLSKNFFFSGTPQVLLVRSFKWLKEAHHVTESNPLFLMLTDCVAANHIYLHRT